MTLERSDVVERVREIAAVQGGADLHEVNLQTRLEDDLGYDSLDRIEFAMQAEETFGVEIPDDAAEQVHTVEEAVDLVLRLCAPASSASRRPS